MLIDEIPIPIPMNQSFWHTHNETHNEQSKKRSFTHSSLIKNKSMIPLDENRNTLVHKSD